MRSPRRSIALMALCSAIIAILCVSQYRSNVTARVASISKPVSLRSSIPLAASSPAPANSPGPDDHIEKKSEVENFRFANNWGKETDQPLQQFSTWANRYINAPVAERPALESEGIALAQKRRPIVHSLIKNEPKLALAETIPAVIRAQLPPSVTSLIEQRITGRGDFLVLARTDPQNVPTIARRADVNGHTYDAYVYGERASQKTSRQISLHGIAIDDDLALSESPLRAFEEGEPVPADKPVASASCVISEQPAAPTAAGPRAGAVAAESADKVYWLCSGGHIHAAAEGVTAAEGGAGPTPYAAFGARSILVILVDFPNIVGGPTSQAQARDNLQTTASFIQENAVSQITFPNLKVTPVLRVPHDTSFYETRGGDNTLLSDARSAAEAAGYQPSNYDFDVVCFTGAHFPWSGQGYVGGKGAWVIGSFPPGTAAHELGHNLGLWHANSWISSTITGNFGRHEEYGNPFDVMGGTWNFPNHYSANFKRHLGWMTAQNIQTVTTSGVYRIYAHDQNSLLQDRQYAIRIPVGMVRNPSNEGDAEVEDYWIDFRQAQTERFPATASGAIIQWGNDQTTASASRLLDTTPETPGEMEDAPLALGGTFIDSENYLQIKNLQKGGSGADAYLDLEVTITAPPSISLAEALDNSELQFTTPTNNWSGQALSTHDGVDALSSGTTRDSQSHTIDTTVVGPGAISFWWKVSSERNFDFLELLIDGVKIASTSGEVPWENRAYDIAAGSHTVRWSYRKDGSSLGGSDRAWLDEVAFLPGEHAPHINRSPAPLSLLSGETAVFTVDASGSAPLRYQWFNGPTALTNQTNATLTLTNIQLTDAGPYSVTISNSVTQIQTTPAFLSIIQSVPVAEAVDYFNTQWQLDTVNNWRGQTDVSHDGVDAARAAPIGNSNDSSLSAIFQGPGILTFWWKVSSEEGYDFLALNVDGAFIEKHSGEFPWTEKTVLIPSGTHSVEWVYYKDTSDFEGLDTAWLDQVRFEPATNMPPIISAQPAPQSVSLGGAAIFNAQAVGAVPMTYQWYLNDAPISERPGITGAHSLTLKISDIQPTDAGDYTLHATNSLGFDISAPATLSIVEFSLADAVEQHLRAFIPGGVRPWSPQTAFTHDNVHAAASPQLGDDEKSSFETTVVGPGSVSFWWYAESEQDYDLLTFEIDNTIIDSISGLGGWQHPSADFGPGQHTLRWTYQKDNGVAVFRDKAWVDQIQIASADTQPTIVNLNNEPGVFNGRVEPLVPFSGNLIIECSTNLVNWAPISTNQITTSSFTFRRECATGQQFLRAKIQ